MDLTLYVLRLSLMLTVAALFYAGFSLKLLCIKQIGEIMKNMPAILLAALTLVTLCWNDCLSQETVFSGCSSAGTLSSPVSFDCDFPDSFLGPGQNIYLNYKGQGDGNFIQAPMSLIGDTTYYEHTYEVDVNFSSNPGVLEFYFSAEAETIMATQSPRNSANQFPPSADRYAHFLEDPPGDAENSPAGTWLDLTGSGMSYSDTKVYGYLDNVSGTWPLSQGLNYFVYAIGFLVTSADDSLYYALAYGNVPLILSSGLYRINLTDTSFTRIGDINYNVSGGLLHLSCDLSEFENDSGWPGWPPPQGFLITMGGTITAGLLDQNYNDFTYITCYEPQTGYLDFSANTAPILTSSEIILNPEINIIPKIHYRDSENNLPVIRAIVFNSSVSDLGSYDHVYTNDSEFATELPWPGDGWSYYYFEFSDGSEVVATPLDSLLIGSSAIAYLPGDANMYNGAWPPAVIGADVTYLVNYFRGMPSNPACLLSGYYCAADINADCRVIGSDVTRMVSYFRNQAAIEPCPDYQPAWLTPDDCPEEAPSGWPDCGIAPISAAAKALSGN